MNYVQFYLYLQLLPMVTGLLYPCEYTDSTRRRLKCDLCQCLSVRSTDSSSSNLCSLVISTCTDRSNNESIDSKLEQFIPGSDQAEQQIEFHHFNSDLLEHEQICSINHFSQLTLVHFTSNLSLNSIPNCLASIRSLRFISSTIRNMNFFSEILLFSNTTFDFSYFNSNTTKVLIIHSSNFLIKPLTVRHFPSLTHSTITETEGYHFTGTFPHLFYLNLCSTKLTDKQLNKIFLEIHVPDLTTLVLADNYLTYVTNKFPSTIRYLDLSRNHIKSLDYYSFKSLYSLNILNLSSNAPLEIQQDTFTRIPYLEVLDLSYSLPTLPFDDLFLPLQKLRHLNISANSLDTLPPLPIPYDVHTIESYDQHLPVLYVDLSYNSVERLDLEVFSTPSTQDKYILSLNINHNQLRTLNFSASFFNGTKRRGPFIELDINNNPLECHCSLYDTIVYLLQNGALQRKRATANLPSLTNSDDDIQSRLFQQTSSTDVLPKQTRVKFLHFFNLTCINILNRTVSHPLTYLNSSNSFCSYTRFCPSTCSCCLSNTCDCYLQCPSECSCRHSYDLSNNYVNCSNTQLKEMPRNVPSSTTHLYLNNNAIKSVSSQLPNLRYLSLTNNSLEYLSKEQFFSMRQIETLDLSFNQIRTIQTDAFANLFQLKRLYLHNNPWIPKFDQRNEEFESNRFLSVLTYANGLSCNRSLSNVGRALTAVDCCPYPYSESCQSRIGVDQFTFEHDDNSTISKSFLIILVQQKFILIGFILILFVVILSLITFYIYRKKRLVFSKSKYSSNGDLKRTNANSMYDRSLSYTDEDDYASIPITISQSDLTHISHFSSIVPPLPPSRHFVLNRPISHSSSSTKGPSYSSSMTTTRSCLQIKLDVLVLYSISDSEYVHENLGQQLEHMYGKRFSFYFIHRDRMLGVLEWLIENSCTVLLILRKPYHDYMRILSCYSANKCFIMLIDLDPSARTNLLKIREKIAQIYRTTNIYEWNSNPNSLVHEQLELFLEQNCGSAIYVTD